MPDFNLGHDSRNWHDAILLHIYTHECYN